MNEYERLRRQAIVLRDMYPPGTRVECLCMNDPFAPVPSGTKRESSKCSRYPRGIEDKYRISDSFTARLVMRRNTDSSLKSRNIVFCKTAGQRNCPSKTYVPMHVRLKESFLAKRSTLLLEQIRTIDKQRLLKKIGSLSENSMADIAKLLDKNFYIQGKDSR